MKTESPLSNWLSVRTHVTWYVRYCHESQNRTAPSILNLQRPNFGRSQDFFRNISESSEGSYLPWTKEGRRASLVKATEFWINQIRDHVGELRLREFAAVAAFEFACDRQRERSTKTTFATYSRFLGTIFTYAW